MTSPYRQTHISLYGHPQRFFSAARPATAVLCWLSLPAPPPHETPDQYRRARPGARHRLLRTGFRADLTRRLGPAVAEMSGAQAPSICWKGAGTPAAGATRQPRDYARHWTPVHLDVVVDDVDAAVARAVAAGARLEDPAATHAWGRIAHLSDPFGHGICLLQFLGRGYDELAEPALRYPAVSEADFEDLLALRIAAMRESLERLGRFDPERARSRLRHLPPGIHLGNRAGRKTRRLLRAAPGRRRPAPGPPVPAPIGPGPGPGRPHAQRLLAQADARPAAARGRPARQRFEPLLPAPRLRPGRRKRMGHRIPAPRAGENRG